MLWQGSQCASIRQALTASSHSKVHRRGGRVQNERLILLRQRYVLCLHQIFVCRGWHSNVPQMLGINMRGMPEA